MQRTCLAYFGNMHIGKFAAPDTHVLRSGEAQYMSQTLMQLDAIKCGEHIWPNEKARASRDLTSKNIAGPVTFQISLFYAFLPVFVLSLAYLVAERIVAIDVARARFPADTSLVRRVATLSNRRRDNSATGARTREGRVS